MKSVLAIVSVVVVSGLLHQFLRSRVVISSTATAGQIPSVVAQLEAAGGDGSFAVFMFTQPGLQANEDTSLNLQYSIESSRVGLDWVLIGPQNIADKGAVTRFIASKDFHVGEYKMNTVRYLRVEGDGIEELGVEVVAELFWLGRNASLDLITEGFTWRP